MNNGINSLQPKTKQFFYCYRLLQSNAAILNLICAKTASRNKTSKIYVLQLSVVYVTWLKLLFKHSYLRIESMWKRFKREPLGYTATCNSFGKPLMYVISLYIPYILHHGHFQWCHHWCSLIHYVRCTASHIMLERNLFVSFACLFYIVILHYFILP